MRFPVLCSVVLMTVACQQEAESPSAEAEQPLVEVATPAAEPLASPVEVVPPSNDEARTAVTDRAPAPAVAGFDPSSVPESTAVLPPFPLLRAPEGVASVLGPREKSLGGGRQQFLVDDALAAVEGEVWRDRYFLESRAKPMAAAEFHRHYEQAIGALGGQRISRVQFSEALLAAHGGREAVTVESAGAPPLPENEHATYLIRQRGQEFWIAVSTGTVPLHGFVVVLQRSAAVP